MIDSPYRIDPGTPAGLKDRPTDDKGEFKSKRAGEVVMAEDLATLVRLQDVLAAEAQRSILVVLQALDAGGKDGTIKHVFSGVNPQGCSVVSFKEPSTTELAHDYFWRVHDAAPRRGSIGIFNRSHYEDVVTVRVHKLVPKSVWSRRFDHINDFERMLVDEGTTILKLFLHISKEEQRKRLEERLSDPDKNWKFSPTDAETHALWEEYVEAYEDALTQCSTPHAPWYVIPADRKWFRNWAVADILVRAVESLHLKYPKPLADVEKIAETLDDEADKH